MSEVTQTADTSCILVCAGNASRMGGIKKILMPLGESNVVGYSMLAFEQTPDITEIIVVTKPEYFDAIRAEAEKLGITKLKHLTEGGETRQKSVMQGLRLVAKESQYVAIHDGARPLVKPAHIAETIKDARVFGGATLGVPVKDTIKIVDDGLIIDTPHRPSLWITQTPQVFRKRLYFEAVDFAEEHGLDFTDDCQLVEAIGGKVFMTRGDYTNIKITTPEDQAIAEVLLK
ncbi:MAG: 2-C-methyl-D-erythritol 4-phosphate cytidylyltransferase [Oscillospiraceae bacterium]|nr:2-C-methyl-D-erythritol 4-phosphate cytidylyltransferase [Oscillospiraceae bacterium]